LVIGTPIRILPPNARDEVELVALQVGQGCVVPDDLPSYRTLIQAANCGLVELAGRRELLDSLTQVFAIQPAA
jgi:hypothetical protein